MKNTHQKKDRVFAYQLATPLEHDKLAHIAGGQINSKISYLPTSRPSVTSATEQNIVIDMQFD